MWPNTDLGNFMTYNSYVNEEKIKECDLNVKVIYDLDSNIQYCKHSDLQIGERFHLT